MTSRKIVCLPCKGRGHFDTGVALLHCSWCKGTGHNIEPVFEFTLNELKALYRLNEYNYINPQDEEAHEVVRKIQTYIKGK